MLGLLIIFLFNFFLHVFCNSTKTIANSIETINLFQIQILESFRGLFTENRTPRLFTGIFQR